MITLSHKSNIEKIDNLIFNSQSQINRVNLINSMTESLCKEIKQLQNDLISHYSNDKLPINTRRVTDYIENLINDASSLQETVNKLNTRQLLSSTQSLQKSHKKLKDYFENNYMKTVERSR